MREDQILMNHKVLRQLLPILKAGGVPLLEYGELDKLGGYYSALRIRFMNTAGGPQFQLRELTSLGQEGSGFYTPDAQELADYALMRVIKYHMPVNPRFMRGTVPDLQLGWFATHEMESKLRPSLPDTLFPGEVTFTLEAPEKL